MAFSISVSERGNVSYSLLIRFNFFKSFSESSYDIGPDYALELTRDDNEDNPYTEYTTSIKMKFFLNPFY